MRSQAFGSEEFMRQAVGRYRIRGKVGEGGMGVVYVAQDELLERSVALKLLREATADPSARERVWREARSAASVSHPNLCQVFEVGEYQGEVFIAMELLEGESLSARLARGPIPAAEAVQTTLGILAGLAALHLKGIVHRDLKPSNVFLTRHGVKLLDFGVAKSCAQGVAHSGTDLTLPGTLVGTPGYTAPEQVLGEDVDARADLFSAGAVLFEMLAGKPPFNGTSLIEIAHSVLHDQPPALIGSGPVVALDRVVRRALAKKREARPSSAHAMAEELRSAAQQLGAGESPRVRAITRLLVLPFRLLRPDPEIEFLSYSLADAIASSVSEFESVAVRSSALAAQFAGASDLKAIASEADVDIVLLGNLLSAGSQLRVGAQLVAVPEGTILWSQSIQTRVGDVFQLHDEVVGRIAASLSLPLSAREQRALRQDVPATSKAYEYYLRANDLASRPETWDLARDFYVRCLEEDPRYAPAWAKLGRIYRVLGKFVGEQMQENLARAEQSLQKALELNPELSLAHLQMALLELDLGRSQQAMVRLLERLRTRTGDPNLFAGLVTALRYCGLLEASVAAHERARRLDPSVVTSVPFTFWAMGDYERALEESWSEPFGYVAGVILAVMGRTKQAVAVLREREEGHRQARVVGFVRSLRALLEGNREECVESVLSGFSSGFSDPEGLYCLNRKLAYLGDSERALNMLEAIVERGYFCVGILTRDPWLGSLRAHPRFSATLRRAEERRRQAAAVFQEIGGNRLLGVISDSLAA
jgi:serine/threonine protein kinase/tetratricopeptide (TPR) repeat protein